MEVIGLFLRLNLLGGVFLFLIVYSGIIHPVCQQNSCIPHTYTISSSYKDITYRTYRTGNSWDQNLLVQNASKVFYQTHFNSSLSVINLCQMCRDKIIRSLKTYETRKFLELLTKILWVFFAMTRPVSDKVQDFIYIILCGRSKQLPPIRDKLLLMSATDLAKAIRTRKVTSEEVIQVYIRRIKEVNPLINAYIDQRFQAAVSDARAIDKMLQARHKSEEDLEREMPLLGVPFTCKEIVGIKGMAQTMGLRRFKDRKAPVDGETAALFRKAGAIPLAVTNIPTISMWWQTSNLLYGMTKNPFDSHRMVGGSSGGEAAILTSAGSVIGIGTDIGGSIRIPASFCGIYGHKPSRGIISNHRPTPTVNTKLDAFRSTGPMCRYVQDLHLLFKILSAKGSKKLRLDENVDFKKVNVFYVEGFSGWLSATSEVKSAVRKAAKHFEDEFGIKASALQIEEFRSSFDIWMYKFLEADGSPLLPDIADKNGNIKWPWEMMNSLLNISDYDIPIIYFASIGKRHKDEHYFHCLSMFKRLEEKLKKCLEGDSILLLPTFPELPPHFNMSIPKVISTGYTSIFNSLGYPVTQIPAGFSRGLPIGIQAVSALHNDHLTLAAALELDKVFKGWHSPCLSLVDM